MIYKVPLSSEFFHPFLIFSSCMNLLRIPLPATTTQHRPCFIPGGPFCLPQPLRLLNYSSLRLPWTSCTCSRFPLRLPARVSHSNRIANMNKSFNIPYRTPAAGRFSSTQLSILFYLLGGDQKTFHQTSQTVHGGTFTIASRFDKLQTRAMVFYHL